MKQLYILINDDPDKAEIFTTSVKAFDERIKISAEKMYLMVKETKGYQKASANHSQHQGNKEN